MTRRKCCICGTTTDDFRLLPKKKINKIIFLFNLLIGSSDQQQLASHLLDLEGKSVCWSHSVENLGWWCSLPDGPNCLSIEIDERVIYVPLPYVQRLTELSGSSVTKCYLSQYFVAEKQSINKHFPSSAQTNAKQVARFVDSTRPSSPVESSCPQSEVAPSSGKPRQRKQDLSQREKIQTFLIEKDGTRVPLNRSRSLSPVTNHKRIIDEINQRRNSNSRKVLTASNQPCLLGSCGCCKAWKAKKPLANIYDTFEGTPIPSTVTTPAPRKDDSATSVFSVGSSLPPPEMPSLTTIPELKQSYFMVNGQKLLDLCKACPTCCKPLGSTKNVSLRAQGTCPILYVGCKDCWELKKKLSKWEGQERTTFRMYDGNVATVSAALTTGNRFSNLNRFAGQLRLNFVSKSSYVRISRVVREGTVNVYETRSAGWNQYVQFEYERQGLSSLQIAADGSYDSRGYSALIGKTVVADQLTNLIIDVETMHASQTGYKSGNMEIEGLRSILDRLPEKCLPVGSVTTDRSTAFAKMIREYNVAKGLDIIHKYDAWHLVKWLGNKIREESKKSGCEILLTWAQKLKTHLFHAIELGETSEDTQEIRFLFNTCLHHIAGVHSWPLNPEVTGPYTECGHPPITAPRDFEIPEGDKAYSKLKEIILKTTFQRDLPKASIRGTSYCETKNAIDRIYCPKEVFIPHSTYHPYALMSVLHLNELTMAEEEGKRKIIHEYDVKRKYQDRISQKKVKTEVKHTWRDDIHREVIKLLIQHREHAVLRRHKKKDDDKMDIIPSDDESDSEAETEVELDSDEEDVSEWVHSTVMEEEDRVASRSAFAGLQLDPDSDSDYEGLPHQDYAYDKYNGFTNESYEEYLIRRSNKA